MAKTLKLNESEIAVMTAAASRRSRSAMPLPAGIDRTAPKTLKLIQRLLGAGLIEERSTKATGTAWRRDDAGQHIGLRITDAGKAVVSSPVPDAAGDTVIEKALPPPEVAPSAPRGKLGTVSAAIQADQGASLDELIALTGWLPHTVRACISRLRQAGTTIRMEATKHGRRYVSSPQSAGGAQ